jgi:hypothetical protein
MEEEEEETLVGPQKEPRPRARASSGRVVKIVCRGGREVERSRLRKREVSERAREERRNAHRRPSLLLSTALRIGARNPIEFPIHRLL